MSPVSFNLSSPHCLFCIRRAILNLCIAYTSQDEIASAVQACVRNAIENDTYVQVISPCHRSSTFIFSDVTEHDIEKELMTSRGGSPPLDILIRTSGVKRLSDFMLWQVGPIKTISSFPVDHRPLQCCENTQIQFTSGYWPDFGLFDFIPIILNYQRKVWNNNIS